MPTKMPLSLAGEDISEEKGVDLADFGRHPIAPDGTYMFFFFLFSKEDAP